MNAIIINGYELALNDHGQPQYSADGDAVLVRVGEFAVAWRHVSVVFEI